MKLPAQTKFLFCPDEIGQELYLLHREFPACLIWIKQETPVRFIVMDLYDDVEDVDSILTMPFVQDAKDFFNRMTENSLDKN